MLDTKCVDDNCEILANDLNGTCDESETWDFIIMFTTPATRFERAASYLDKSVFIKDGNHFSLLASFVPG